MMRPILGVFFRELTVKAVQLVIQYTVLLLKVLIFFSDSLSI